MGARHHRPAGSGRQRAAAAGGAQNTRHTAAAARQPGARSRMHLNILQTPTQQCLSLKTLAPLRLPNTNDLPSHVRCLSTPAQVQPAAHECACRNSQAAACVPSRAMPLPGFANAFAPLCDSGRWLNESLRPIAPSLAQARAAKLQVALYREMLRGLPALTDDQVSTVTIVITCSDEVCRTVEPLRMCAAHFGNQPDHTNTRERCQRRGGDRGRIINPQLACTQS